jgi:ATP-dependent RNA helicase DeaD
MKRFTEFPLTIDLLEALHDMRFHICTPIQEKVIPIALEGRDVAGMAQTGTGKTLAFLVPIMNMLKPSGHTQVLIVCPTRELALQVGGVAAGLGARVGLKTSIVYGGTSLGSQRKEVYGNPDVIVGTPGRLIEFIRTSVIRMRHLRWLVLDEADRMLDMGFIEDVDFILKSAPPSRQTMLFSATLSSEVMKIASQYMHSPVTVQVSPPTLLAERVKQLVYRVPPAKKDEVLIDVLRADPPDLCLVFTARREDTTLLARKLRAAGFEAGSLSSLQSQTTREAIVRMFKSREFKILVATDVAGRGLDITGISHVVNYDAPMDPEDYVHRIGRTARAGREGLAITLVGTSQDEKRLAAIERLTKMPIPAGEHRHTRQGEAPRAAAEERKSAPSEEGESKRRRRGGGRGGRGRRRGGAHAPRKAASGGGGDD